MDFLRYADRAAGLVNADLPDVDALAAYLAGRDWLPAAGSDRDCIVLRRFQREVRAVFEASAAGDAAEVVGLLNELMARHPLTMRIESHAQGDLHLHAAAASASVAEQLIGESLIGLVSTVVELGPTRLGVCAATPCRQVFVDTSPNATRRYCSDRCSSRANVAAYRARQRAGAGA